MIDGWSQVAALANLGIVAGYIAVPFTALRLLPMQPCTKVAGMAFFLTCASTHLYMAFGDCGGHTPRHGLLFWVMLLNHLVQAVAVWVFVLGLAAAVRAAITIRRHTPALTVEVPGDSDDIRRV